MDAPIKRYTKISDLDLSAYPTVALLAERLLAVWPEHEGNLATSLGNRDAGMLADTEVIAKVVKKIAENHCGSLDVACADYRFFCQELVLPSELHFRRTGRYERSKFEEANRDIYSNGPLMDRYMNGLLMSEVFWSNHMRALSYFRTEFLPMLPEGFAHLEVGPGHGALLYLAATNPNHGRVVGWDISPTSIEATKRALQIVGVEKEVELILQDMYAAEAQNGAFDSVVMSELLEHLEDPLKALRAMYPVLKPGGLIYVNIPANSPAPDHLYLFDKPTDLSDMMKEAGFIIEKEQHIPMTGYTLERCVKDKLTVTCVAIGRRPA